jgi:hypothetical protein
MIGGAIGVKLEHAFSNKNTEEFAALAERTHNSPEERKTAAEHLLTTLSQGITERAETALVILRVTGIALDEKV